MRFAIKTWVRETDQPTTGSLFGVLDADTLGQLPIPSSDGHWENVRTVDQDDFKKAHEALDAIALTGHYLFSASNSGDGVSNEITIPPTGRSEDDVVSARDLSKNEKIEILAQREEDGLSLQRAADEGMCGGERSRLDEVLRAQKRLSAKKP